VVKIDTVGLVRRQEQNWFSLKPDLLIKDDKNSLLVLDTKLKLLDALKANGTNNYGLTRDNFYQLQAYGQSYLDGSGDVVLIYPMTEAFDRPLPVLDFSKTNGLRLWALPFCLKSRQLTIPDDEQFKTVFKGACEQVT